jgi:hypothetical protein
VSLDPAKVVASFDSASVLHAATVAALQHRDFPHLGNPGALALLARLGGRLPWPMLREVYARIGGAEGLDPGALGEVDLTAVAASFARAYRGGPYPALFLGSSNGALTHLAAAMGAPWLPGTVLVPVHRVGDAQRPDLALAFGASVAPPLLRANPGVVLHQMHDAAQDEIMVARMTYFRVKWTDLPLAYGRFLTDRLAPGAPVLVVDDASAWPVTRVGERHVFQAGGQGGLTPEEYLARPHAPAAEDRAPEAEWGADPGFTAGAISAATAAGHPVVRLRFDGPQAIADPVARAMRRWVRDRGGAGDRLLVPSFVLGDPWRTIELGDVPFWTFFPVQDALAALRAHLAAEPYRAVDVLLFEHGADSPGIARPEEWEAAVRDAGAEPRLLALRRDAFPHDIGLLGRYGPALGREPDAELPFAPLPPEDAADALAPWTSPARPPDAARRVPTVAP